MREIALTLQIVGFAVYSVPIIWYAMRLFRMTPDAPLVPLIRRFQRVGPVLGLALGACIVGGLVGAWMDHGGFELGLSSNAERLDSAIAVTFFSVWVSNIKLEIWTLDPIRKADTEPESDPSTNPRYCAAAMTLKRHLALHALGVISVIILGAVR